MRMKVLVLVAAAVLLPMQADAQVVSDSAKKCAGTAAQGYTSDTIIEACSAIIREGGYPGILSGAYYNRGNAYFDKSEFAKAIADYDHALSLRPDFRTAMFNRGLAKKHLGDNAGGDADIAASKAMQQ
jgi:tetratricopeptide (TPR) repeat protein